MTERGDPLAGIESGTLAPEGVRTMFDRIAPVYDVMNHVMTVGLDRRWRRWPSRSYGLATACSTPAVAPVISRLRAYVRARAVWSASTSRRV